MTNVIRPIICIAGALTWTASIGPSAAPGHPLDENVVIQLDRLQQDWTVPGRDDVAKAKAAMLVAARQLDAYLRRSGDRWPGLEEALQWTSTLATVKTLETADPDALDALLRTCRGNVPGMARPEVVRFRDALRACIRAVRGMRAAEDEQEIRAHLQGLQFAAGQYAADHGALNRRRLLEHLAWLRDRGLATDAIEAFQKHLDRPNLYLHVGQEFLTASLGGPVRESTPVRDVILDTDIVGSGVVTGTLGVHPVPSREQAVLEFVFQGRLDSQTVGYNGPVQLHSVAQTNLTARQRITVAEQGLQIGSTTVQATSASQLQAICTRARGCVGCLVRRVARRMHHKSHARADCIAARHAERDFQVRVKDDTEESLLPANKSYLAEFRTPLIRLDQYPQLLKFSTGAQKLHIVMLQAQDSQLAAPDAPPSVADTDVAMRLHETFANNFADGLLAGTTMSDEELTRRANALLGTEVAQAGSPQDQPVFITFADRNPLEFIVADDAITVTVRGQRFRKDNSIYPAMNVTVCYRIESTPSGTRAVLSDEPLIIPPRLADGAPGDLAFREIALRRLLRNLLARDLQREIKLAPFELAVSADKKVKLQVEHLGAVNGWISCDLELVEPLK